MSKSIVALAAGIFLLFGCSHVRSTMPQPIGNFQVGKKHEGMLPAALQMNYRVLYSFQGGADGAGPTGDLIRDSAGNLYGVTDSGGTVGKGVIFKVDQNGHESVLHSFDGIDGQNPSGGLIRDATGNFYGVAQNSNSRAGLIYKLDTNGTLTVLHSFSGPDGADPEARLIRDGQGNLYGTTFQGGSGCAFGCGVVFKLDPKGNETVLRRLNYVNGRGLIAGVERDAAGNLYGAAFQGGTFDQGDVFKLDAGGKLSVLHYFHYNHGNSPQADLLRDAAGNLYGTTAYGGSSHEGVVFKIDSTGNYTLLHSFDDTDGSFPMADLIRDSNGDLFGTTSAGGASGQGVIFKLDSSGNETVLHSFCSLTNCADGKEPDGGVIRDSAGNLYGTTFYGGSSGCQIGCGVVFKLTH
jgi:uncharacterized repeat protein (TIGR03803 family)